MKSITRSGSLGSPDEAAPENRDQLCCAVDVVLANWKEVDPPRTFGVPGDHRARGIGAGVAAWTFGVGDAYPAPDVHTLLPDSLIALIFVAQAYHQLLALDLVEVVEPDRHLQLHGQGVGDIDQRVYAW